MKKTAFILIVVVLFAMFSASVFGLYYPDSYYDAISWTWSYSDTYTTSYNCLGYATGSMVWEWPWGSSNPTLAQANSYLTSLGYSTSGTNAYILAYGPSSLVTHFSRVTGTSWCRAKWGSLERFNHGSWDPYYYSSVYGRLMQRYYQ